MNSYPNLFIKIPGPRILILFFFRGEEIIREGVRLRGILLLSGKLAPFIKFHSVHLGTLLREGCPLVRGYFNGEIRVCIS